MNQPVRINSDQTAVVGDFRDLVLKGVSRDSLFSCHGFSAYVARRLRRQGVDLEGSPSTDYLERLLTAAIELERRKDRPGSAVLGGAEAIGMRDPKMADPPCPRYEDPDDPMQQRLRRAGQFQRSRGKPIKTARNAGKDKNIGPCLHALFRSIEEFSVESIPLSLTEPSGESSILVRPIDAGSKPAGESFSPAALNQALVVADNGSDIDGWAIESENEGIVEVSLDFEEQPKPTTFGVSLNGLRYLLRSSGLVFWAKRVRFIIFLLAAFLDPVLLIWTASFPPAASLRVFGIQEVTSKFIMSLVVMSLLALGFWAIAVIRSLQSAKEGLHFAGWTGVATAILLLTNFSAYVNHLSDQARVDYIIDDPLVSSLGTQIPNNITLRASTWNPVFNGFIETNCPEVSDPVSDHPSMSVSCSVLEESLHLKAFTTRRGVISYQAGEIAAGEYYVETTFRSGTADAPTLCGLQVITESGEFLLRVRKEQNQYYVRPYELTRKPVYRPEFLRVERDESESVSVSEAPSADRLAHMPFINFSPKLLNWSNWHYSSSTKLAVYGEGNQIRFFVDDIQALRAEVDQFPVTLGLAAVTGSDKHGGAAECVFDSLKVRASD
ncbi:hypothetical protein KIF24_05465 [Micromonospora sp. Llam7]|uniref:hypothetical protein n=1 Tax=Micromonospora tarapacensis TaxID=2835305 RepID=UPI001C838C15|nr:hypothetical protein [Micromonospora tarapacensis]MBX7265546.1 hypothetical protein [Micromonospora tarapacensis]